MAVYERGAGKVLRIFRLEKPPLTWPRARRRESINVPRCAPRDQGHEVPYLEEYLAPAAPRPSQSPTSECPSLRDALFIRYPDTRYPTR
ncbi:hypothetical protein KM043_009866 [Ampulex compressa]|nr:hypothetical protein KM043_009866 [Ampulex compressa]